MSHSRKSYPDVSDILARKAQAGLEIARRPYGEKIEMVERMRERIAPLKRAREVWRERQRLIRR
jgi:fibrillarin-like rRNA methylase